MDTIENYLKHNKFYDALCECSRHGDTLLKQILFDIYGDKNIETTQQESIIKQEQPIIDNVSVCIDEQQKDKKIINIKLLCNWLDSEEICNLWNKMSKGNYTWNNIKIGWNFETEPDYYVVINSTTEPIIKKKTIVFQMEPDMVINKEKWGIWSNLDKNEFLKVFEYTTELNNCEYHINKTYTELKTFIPEKKYNTCLSTILSDKYKDIGHTKRVDFIKFLDTKNDIDVHVYGSNKWDYKNYKKELPYHIKDDGLFPYKYTFNAENTKMNNYITEKLYDAILSECLLFYWGADNVCDHIDPRAYIQLNLSNFELDYLIVKKYINSDEWSKRLPYIRQAKHYILDKLQFFPRVEQFLSKITEL